MDKQPISKTLSQYKNYSELSSQKKQMSLMRIAASGNQPQSNAVTQSVLRMAPNLSGYNLTPSQMRVAPSGQPQAGIGKTLSAYQQAQASQAQMNNSPSYIQRQAGLGQTYSVYQATKTPLTQSRMYMNGQQMPYQEVPFQDDLPQDMQNYENYEAAYQDEMAYQQEMYNQEYGDAGYMAEPDAYQSQVPYQDQYLDQQPSMFVPMEGGMTPTNQSQFILDNQLQFQQEMMGQNQNVDYQNDENQLQAMYQSDPNQIDDQQLGQPVESIPGIDQQGVQESEVYLGVGTRSVSKIQSQIQPSYTQRGQTSAISMFQGGQTPQGFSMTDARNKYETITEEQSDIQQKMSSINDYNSKVTSQPSNKVVIDYSAKDGVAPPQSGIADVEFEEDDDPEATMREVDPDAISIVQQVYTAPPLDYENQLGAIQEDEDAELENQSLTQTAIMASNSPNIPQNYASYNSQYAENPATSLRSNVVPSMMQQPETPPSQSFQDTSQHQPQKIPSMMRQPSAMSQYRAAPGTKSVNGFQPQATKTESRYNSTAMRDGHTLPTPSRLNALSDWQQRASSQQSMFAVRGQPSTVSYVQAPPPIITEEPSSETNNAISPNMSKYPVSESKMDTLQVTKRGRSKSPNTRHYGQTGTSRNTIGGQKQIQSNYSIQSSSPWTQHRNLQEQQASQKPGLQPKKPTDSQYSVMIRPANTPPSASLNSMATSNNAAQNASQYSVMLQGRQPDLGQTSNRINNFGKQNPSQYSVYQARNAPEGSRTPLGGSYLNTSIPNTSPTANRGNLYNSSPQAQNRKMPQSSSQYSVMLPGTYNSTNGSATPPNMSQVAVNQPRPMQKIASQYGRMPQNSSQYSVMLPRTYNAPKESATPTNMSQVAVNQPRKMPQSSSQYSVMLPGNMGQGSETPKNGSQIFGGIQKPMISPAQNASQYSVMAQQNRPTRQNPSQYSVAPPRGMTTPQNVNRNPNTTGNAQGNSPQRFNKPISPSQHSVMVGNFHNVPETPPNMSRVALNQQQLQQRPYNPSQYSVAPPRGPALGNAQSKSPQQLNRQISPSQYSVMAGNRQTEPATPQNMSRLQLNQQANRAQNNNTVQPAPNTAKLTRPTPQNPSQFSVFQQPNSPRNENGADTPKNTSQHSVVKPKTQQVAPTKQIVADQQPAQNPTPENIAVEQDGSGHTTEIQRDTNEQPSTNMKATIDEPPPPPADDQRSPSPINPLSSGREQDTYQSLSSEPPSEAFAEYEPELPQGEPDDAVGPTREATTPQPPAE